MNFLGMGTLEVLIVLLVAFIFLGPERMVNAGRLLGKMVRELRRMSSELSISLEENDVSPGEQPGPRNAATRDPSSSEGEARATEAREGPVSFRPSASSSLPQAQEYRPPRQEEP